jgi:hypothetical protein
MKVNKISKDLYEIEDFVTVEQQSKILDFLKNLDEQDWYFDSETEGENYKNSMWYGKQYIAHEEIASVREVREAMEGLFFQALKINPLSLQRYKKEDFINEHRDYWIYDLPYHIRYGICIYYNDDYEGGELEYAELGIVHKPKARSLVMHGGNILHRSLPVKSNSLRYFSTSFVHGSKDVPVILNENVFAGIHEEDGSIYG